MKFFTSDNSEENSLIENEINNNVFVRANMSPKKAMEEALKKNEKKFGISKKNKKILFLQNKSVKPKYCDEPTPGEIIATFNLIMKCEEQIEKQESLES